MAEEPLDQIPAAVALSGVAVTLTTAGRAAMWEAEGLVSRRLSPTPVVDYGIAYKRDNPFSALRNMLQIVDQVAPALPNVLAEGFELIWTPDEIAKPAGRSVAGMR